MNRQELFSIIRKKVKENPSLENLITSKNFLDYPENKYLKDAFCKYKRIYQSTEEWDQFARFALTDPKERAYMYERVIQLLIKYCFPYEKYFKIRSEYATSPFFDRISSLNRLLILYKEYFQIYSDIINKINFDYPKKEYSGKFIKGVIDWSETLKKTPSFPIEFKTKRLYKKFSVPENMLLILCAFWLENEATRLLRLDFLEPLDKNEIYILNTIAQKSKKILMLFPFKEVLDDIKDYFRLQINDSRIKDLEILSRKRLQEGIIKNNEYYKLLKWIYKFKQLNIRMFSPNHINFPIDNISSLDTIYEVWIFFEIIDYVNKNVVNVKPKLGKDKKDEIKIEYFEFRFPKTTKKSVEFHYQPVFYRKDKEIWAGDEITPDFTVITGNKTVIAVFDAKNYTKDNKKGPRDTILAYMFNLHTNYGAILSPKFNHEEFSYLSEENPNKDHSNLKLAYYKLVPKDEKTVIENNNEEIQTILKEIENRLTN